MGELPREVGLLPLRNSVLFPGGVLPLTVSRAATMRSLTDAASRDGLIGVVAQRDAFDELPGAGALFNVGVIAQVVKLVKHPTHCETVLQGLSRFRTVATVRETPFLTASIESFDGEDLPTEADTEALRREALDLLTRTQVPPKLVELVKTFPRAQLASFLSTQLGLEVGEQQSLLEERSGAQLTLQVRTLVQAERARRFWRSEADGLVEALKAVPVLRVAPDELTHPGGWVFPPPGREAVVTRGGLFALMPKQGDVGTLVELTDAKLGDTTALMLKGLHRVRLVQPVIAAPLPHARVEVIEADHAMDPSRALQVLELLLSLTLESNPQSTDLVLASLGALEPGARTDVIAFRYLDVDRAQHLATPSAAARAEAVLARAHTRRPRLSPPRLVDIWVNPPPPAHLPTELSIVALAQALFPGERVLFRVTNPAEGALLERLASGSPLVGVVSRRQGSGDQPATRANVFDVGTLARATHFDRGAGWYSCVLEGLARFRLGPTLTTEPGLRVQVERFVSVADALPDEVASLRADVLAVFALHPQLSRELNAAAERTTEVERFVDAVSGTLGGAELEKQAVLDEAALSRRVRRVHALVATHLSAQLPVGSDERLLAAAPGLPVLRIEEVVVPGVFIVASEGQSLLVKAHPLVAVFPTDGGMVGTISEVVSRDGELWVKGLARCRLQATISEAPVPRVRVEVLFDEPVAKALTDELVERSMGELTRRGATSEARDRVRSLEGGALADHVIIALELSEERRRQAWALTNATERVKQVLAWLNESKGLAGRLRGWLSSS